MNRRKLLFKFVFYDLVASTIVWLLFMVFRKTVVDAQLFGDVKIFIPNYDFLSGFLFFPLSCVFVHYLSGFYRRPEILSKTVILFTTLVSTAIISIVIFFVLMLDDIVISYRYYYYSLLVLFGLLFLITLLFRSFIFSEISKNFRSKLWTIPTLIIGTGKNARMMAEELEKNAPEYTLQGFVWVENQSNEIPKDQVLGYYGNIAEIISKYGIKDVIISLDNADEFQLFKIINALYIYDIDIRFTPRLYEILTSGSKIKMLGVSPLVNITTLHMPDWQFSVKRFLDIIVALIGLVLVIPLFIFIIIKISIDSRGPAFYRQERIGYLGKPFNIIKFRTMYVDSENGTPRLSSAWDERVTPFGRFLRKYRLDELPQLWNILMGDMSLVGPRPERKFYIDQIIERAPYYCLLYKIRPGLTSWGPIRIGYSDTIDKMIERLNYDIIYLDNMSLFTDLKILLQTIEIIFKGKGV
jgi:exopolysaccharide biosynthesis polyprenyl glycosylphosphotransferase